VEVRTGNRKEEACSEGMGQAKLSKHKEQWVQESEVKTSLHLQRQKERQCESPELGSNYSEICWRVYRVVRSCSV
jgi:hypothetical protein